MAGGKGRRLREGMKELVAKRQRAGRGRGVREGWSVGEREDEKGGGKLVFQADKNVNLKIRR